MASQTIRISGLIKKYGNFTAVNNLNLSVKKGEIYALIGPNGAGKTTTLRLILGILKQDAGEIQVFGEKHTVNGLEFKTRIGVCPERHEKNIWGNMTGVQYLNFFADIYRVKNKKKLIDEYLERFELTKFKDYMLSKYSRGMIQKLSLARTLIHDPELIILDEPVSGLDPFGVKEVRDIILERRANGGTVFICSHLLSEVEKICNRVAIINKGKLLVEDSLKSISERLKKNIEIEVEVENANELFKKVLLQENLINSVKIDKNRYILNVKKDKDNQKRISQIFHENNLFILSMRKNEISLEEAFITITKENLSLFTSEANYDA